MRGTPQQIIDKYLTLARDAQLSNDRVAEQSFLQHAEHYTRLLGEAQREMAERQQQQAQNQPNNRQNGEDDRDNGGRENAQRDQGRDNDLRRDNDQQRDNNQRRENDQRDENRNNSISAQTEENRGANETPSSEVSAKSEPEQPRNDSDNAVTTRSRRASKPRSASSESGGKRRKPASESRALEQAEQSAPGLPDVVGASDDGGLVETPETGSPKKTRAKSGTTRSRITTRKKSSDTAGDKAEASPVPAAEPNGGEGEG